MKSIEYLLGNNLYKFDQMMAEYQLRKKNDIRSNLKQVSLTEFKEDISNCLKEIDLSRLDPESFIIIDSLPQIEDK